MKERTEETPLERTLNVLDISTTERSTFKLCRRRWELEVLENLTPRIPPGFEFEFGSGIHRALEAYYISVSNIPYHEDTAKDPDAYAYPLRNALLAWEDWYDETEKRYADDTSYDSTTRELALDNLVELADMGETIIKGYDLYSNEFDDFTVHAIEGMLTGGGQSWLAKHNAEREFKSNGTQNGVIYDPKSRRLLVPILNPKTQRTLPGTPVLSMRIDLLTHRIDAGMKGIWVYDHKTTSGMPNDRGMDFDDQVTSYLYGVYRWLGIIPRGFCFNYLVKHIPKEPRILASGKLSTAKDQLTTADKYYEEMIAFNLVRPDGTIKSHEHEECYLALQSHGWDRFFIRHYVTRNKTELVNFEKRLFEEWRDMMDCWSGELELYPNLSKFWCPRCHVAPICQAMEDGSDWQAVIDNRYDQREDRKAQIGN